MTPQEVIKQLNMLIFTEKILIGCSTMGELQHSQNIEALEFAKQAVEKQIPKKPKTLTYQPLIESGWEHECPNCGCAVGKNKYTDYEYIEPYEDYCSLCGQKLDWSDQQ